LEAVLVQLLLSSVISVPDLKTSVGRTNYQTVAVHELFAVRAKIDVCGPTVDLTTAWNKSLVTVRQLTCARKPSSLARKT